MLARCAIFLSICVAAWGQAGIIRGKVTLEPGTEAVPGATVVLVPLGISTSSDAQGAYEFTGIAPGRYDLLSHMHPFTEIRQRVTLTSGETLTRDLQLRLSPVHEHITVTASGRQETDLNAFQTVETLESMELTANAAPSLGEVLENEPGVAKRSSGPGTTRPVIRGFDGDRVLILQDGMPTGTLSYQSGDHGEPIDAASLERIEVVKGPATLLYGSSAMGGVVNAFSSHHQMHQHAHEGLRGRLNLIGGSNNGMGSGGAGLEYGFGKWMVWGGGGGARTGEYHTPLGPVTNSQTRAEQGNVGLGYFGGRTYGTLSYGLYDGNYGVPTPPQDHGHEAEQAESPGAHEHEGPVRLKFRRQLAHFNGGINNPSQRIERFNLSINYSDWRHSELEEVTVANRFYNKQFTWRGVFDQRKRGPVTGSFGAMGHYRDYKAIGAEAFTPPVTQNALAAFGLEQFNFRRFRLQFGGRVENNRYSPAGLGGRGFTGFSGGAGFQAPLWEGGSFAANYSRSYRAPGLEELYALGPHAGNFTYEIGNVNLVREAADGLDLALRHHGSRVRGEVSYYQYRISDYVYLGPTGEIRDGLIEARYRQGDALYRGVESSLDFQLHPNLWLNTGLDSVTAELRQPTTPLPRIPPLRGRIGFDLRHKGLSLRPGLVLANHQTRIFPTETPTAGYGLWNLSASYVLTRGRTVHIFGVNAFNLSDRLYRNHLSFIKGFAPEIGRGVRVHYRVEFF